MLLQGHNAARTGRQAAQLMVRYLGGDLSLVDEVCALHNLQAELAVEAPSDPRHIFGEAVEVGDPPTSATLAKACTDALAAAVPGIIEQVTQRIDQRLAHLETRQRVSLNVRATSKPALQNPPSIVRSIEGAGRPLPVAKDCFFAMNALLRCPSKGICLHIHVAMSGTRTLVPGRNGAATSGVEGYTEEFRAHVRDDGTRPQKTKAQGRWRAGPVRRAELQARRGGRQLGALCFSRRVLSPALLV